MSVARAPWAPLLALVLAGCVTTQSSQPRFYLLEALPADSAPLADATAAAPLSLDIALLRLPQYLERPQLVTRSAANRLELAEYDQWGGNLAENLLRVTAENLSRLLGTADVSMLSRRPPPAAELRLEIEVLAFERAADGRVRLAARWLLAGGGQPPLVRLSELRSDPVTDTPAFDGTVAAMSGLAARLAREMAAAALERARR